MCSMLEMRRAPRQVFQSTRPFVRIKIIHVSIDPQTPIEIPEKDFENEARKHPKNGAMYNGSWPADHPCAGITLRVQAYSACSTSHLGPAVNRQPGYRWCDSHSSHQHPACDVPRAAMQSPAALCNPSGARDLLWACMHSLGAC